MRKYIPHALFVGLLATAAVAGSIKVWTAGEYITAADLNANFTHLHNTMVGGHGPRLINADVASNANIATSKLAAASYIPKGWARILTTGPAVGTGVGVSAVSRPGGTGIYRLTVPTAPSITYYSAQATPEQGGYCYAIQFNVSTIEVTCYGTSGVATDANFNIAFWGL
ncbi:MAG: hypothetical protein QM729_21470 [Solirubrobacterales bacterium]